MGYCNVCQLFVREHPFLIVVHAARCLYMFKLVTFPLYLQMLWYLLIWESCTYSHHCWVRGMEESRARTLNFLLSTYHVSCLRLEKVCPFSRNSTTCVHGLCVVLQLSSVYLNRAEQQYQTPNCRRSLMALTHSYSICC